MDIRLLRYFISVAEHKNFTAAAKDLHITQPTLSHQIAELERQIGVKLLLRDRHSVQLTAAGTAMLKEAKSIITKTHDAIKIARLAEAGTLGSVQIGFLGASERRFLPQLIAKFRNKYPQIEFPLNYFTSFIDLDKSLLQGNIDIAITLKSKEEVLPEINWKVLYTAPLAVLLSNTHPLAAQAANDLSVLDGMTFFYVERDRGLDHTLQVCSRHGIKPEVRLIPHIQTLLMSVEAGEGFTILPRPIPDTYASSHLLQCIDLSDDDSVVEVIAAWKNDNRNPSIPLFIDDLPTNISI
ncbi:MAG: LysR family transcriptional regulator [Firmicutes bacterium]|nr:LysR family transcriptional regulator [Bacillota bacterium]